MLQTDFSKSLTIKHSICTSFRKAQDGFEKDLWKLGMATEFWQAYWKIINLVKTNTPPSMLSFNSPSPSFLLPLSLKLKKINKTRKLRMLWVTTLSRALSFRFLTGCLSTGKKTVWFPSCGDSFCWGVCTVPQGTILKRKCGFIVVGKGSSFCSFVLPLR